MRHTLSFASALFLLLSATVAEAGVRNFFSPLLEGSRIDACLTGGVCGKPAADAFCKAQGYDKALIFQRESGDGSRAIDSASICSGSSCTVLKQVKCFTTKTDLAGLE